MFMVPFYLPVALFFYFATVSMVAGQCSDVYTLHYVYTYTRNSVEKVQPAINPLQHSLILIMAIMESLKLPTVTAYLYLAWV